MNTRNSVGYFESDLSKKLWEKKPKRNFNGENAINALENQDVEGIFDENGLTNIQNMMKIVCASNSLHAPNFYTTTSPLPNLQYLEDKRSIILSGEICNILLHVLILKIHSIKEDRQIEYFTFASLMFLEIDYGKFGELVNLNFPCLKYLIFKKCPRVDFPSEEFFARLPRLEIIITESLTDLGDLIPFIESVMLAPLWRAIIIKHTKNNCIYQVEIYRTGCFFVSKDIVDNDDVLLNRLMAMFPDHIFVITKFSRSIPYEDNFLNQVINIMREASRDDGRLIRNLYIPNLRRDEEVIKFLLEDMYLDNIDYKNIKLIQHGTKQEINELPVFESEVNGIFEMFRQFPSIQIFKLNLTSTEIDEIISSEVEKIVNPRTTIFDNVQTLEVLDNSGYRGILGVFSGLFKNFRNITKLKIQSSDRNINVLLQEFLPSMQLLEEIVMDVQVRKEDEMVAMITNNVRNLKSISIIDKGGTILKIFPKNSND